MVRTYELMYIVRPDVDDDGLRGAMESVESIVTGQGGSVLKTTPWGKRRLAYEIDRLRDGHYVLLDVRLDGARVREVERLLQIHDNVFRHMVVLKAEVAEAEDGAEEGSEAAEAGDEDGGVPAETPVAVTAAGEEVGAEAAAEEPAAERPSAVAVEDAAPAEVAGDDEDEDAVDDEEGA